MRLLLAWLALLLPIMPVPVARAGQTPATTPPIKRIVFLFSDEVTTAGNVRIDHGLRIGFAKDPSFRTEFYQEYLDLTRFGGVAADARGVHQAPSEFRGRFLSLSWVVATLVIL